MGLLKGIIKWIFQNQPVETENKENKDDTLDAKKDFEVEKLGDSKSKESLLADLLSDSDQEFSGKNDDISFIGLSKQGSSHKKNGIKSQDKCAIKQIGMSKQLVIAGIADGLGSSSFSNEGAAVAISSAIEIIESQLEKKEMFSEIDITSALKSSMREANNSVSDYANSKKKSIRDFYSTLTIVIYDGKDAFIAHAGDDGVVVLNDTGFYGLVTTRHKGETVNSVVPLQGVTNWEFLIARDIVGVVMATDGVLDAFVHREKEANRVFFPFIQMITQTEKYNEATLLDEYKRIFDSEKLQQIITDDITFVALMNNKRMPKTVFPQFDSSEWFEMNKRRSESVFRALYPEEKLTEEMISSWKDTDRELLSVLIDQQEDKIH